MKIHVGLRPRVHGLSFKLKLHGGIKAREVNRTRLGWMHMSTTTYHEDQVLWTERLPGGHHWSARIQRGAVLQLKSLGANANVSLFCVNSEDKLEAYNMPDSLKGQHSAFLSTGHILASDLGRAMISIVKDDHGWNDAFCAPSTAPQIEQQFGKQSFQVAPDDNGNLSYVVSDNTDQVIELRFEMDCLVFLSSAPHALDNSTEYAPADIQLSLFKALPLGETDVCRDSCPQNQRAFQNNNRYYALTA